MQPAPSPPVDLAALGAEVEWTDRDAGIRGAALIPAWAPGLAPAADWLGSVQAAVPPRAPQRVRLVQFGRAGGAVTARSAADADVAIRVLDELPPAPASAAVAGASVADREVDTGADLVIVACPSPGPAALVAISLLTDTEPARVVARGAAATDPAAWMSRVADIRDRRRAAAPAADRPGELLAALADPALGAAAGFVLQSATRRTPVLLDGLGALASALIAYQAQPRVLRWLAIAAASPDPAAPLVAGVLGLGPLLGLEVDAGDGTAALLVLPVLRVAARTAAHAAPRRPMPVARETGDDEP